MSRLPDTLNSYWLWKEISNKLNLSNPLYKYWKQTPNIKLNNKYIFLQKEHLPDKYMHIEEQLTDLSGYLPIRYASDQLHIDAHVFSSDKMRLHSKFEYKYVEALKFVNISRFFTEYGIKPEKNSLLHLGRLKDLEITADSMFYRLTDDYGLVVYPPR